MKFVMSLLLVLVFCLGGCAITKPTFHSKIPSGIVYIDYTNVWVNQCPIKEFGSHACVSPWRIIVIRVINKKYRHVTVTVECKHSNGVVFGRQTKHIDARNDTYFTVWGFGRTVPDSDKVTCKISHVQ